MAYTKYSLTPANNNATPPDGAPEGMLPSAVNDTMRDMMAQIRDCGDGIRDGTYTMTAPKITGGTITGAAFTGNTFTSPVISGGSINNTPIGASTANTGAFTTLSASGAFSANGGATLGDASGDALTINSSAVSIPNGLNFDSNTLVIDASTNQVGIGTAAPAFTLDVKTTGSNPVFALTRTDASVSGSLRFEEGNSGAFITQFGSKFLAFLTANTERMRITSTGDVGIGTSSPTRLLSVNGAIGALTLRLEGSVNPYVSLNDGTNTSYLQVASSALNINVGGANPITFTTNSSERMRIDSSGNVLVGITSARANAGDVQVSKGISFPATQSAQSDANTLDDYEEGTFTATLTPLTSGTITLSASTCAYTKVGRKVTVTGELNTSAVSSPTGRLRIGSLPFSAGSGKSFDSVATIRVTGAVSVIAIDASIPNTQNFIDVYPTGTTTDTYASNIDGSTVIVFSATYFV